MKTLLRLVRTLFTRKMLGRLLFVTACLVTLAALLVMEENWRGKRDWAAYVRNHESRGEPLDYSSLIPPQVPDDENFAMTPLLKPLFDADSENYSVALIGKFDLPLPPYQKNPSTPNIQTGKRIDLKEWEEHFGEPVLTHLQKITPELRELSEAARRPYARFPIPYEKGFAAGLPHGRLLVSLGRIYALRAYAELQTGDTGTALADVQTIFLLADSVKDEPIFISLLVHAAVCKSGLQVVWEGLLEHRWSDAQLVTLQGILARPDLVKHFSLALRGQRVGANVTILAALKDQKILATLLSMDGKKNNVLGFVPPGLMYRNLLELNRYNEEYLFPAVDVASHRLDSTLLARSEQGINGERTRSFMGIPILHPYEFLVYLFAPAINGVGVNTAYIQNMLSQGIIACALERCHIATGQYPATLEKLVPEYLAKIPASVVNGEALHYRPQAGGTYTLYTDSWDGTNNGGKIIMKPHTLNADLEKGDWVWPVKSG